MRIRSLLALICTALPLAAAPHYRSCAAITGAVSAAEVSFYFEMNVSRLVDTVRITKPFEDKDWRGIERTRPHLPAA